MCTVPRHELNVRLVGRSHTYILLSYLTVFKSLLCMVKLYTGLFMLPEAALTGCTVGIA